MRFTRFLLALLVVLGTSAVASAQIGPKHGQSGTVTVLTLADCADSAADRRFTFSNFGGFALSGVQVDFNYSAATAVTMQCEVSLDGGTTWALLQDCSVSSGTCTSSNATWSKATGSANVDFFWRIDALSAPRLRCTISCTGGGASDTFSAWAVLSAE
jgi:hypothetical protein